MKKNYLLILILIPLIIVFLLAGYVLINSNKSYISNLSIDSKEEIQAKSTKDYILEAFSNKYKLPKETFKIEVLTEKGNFAKGSVNFNNEHSGALWFAVKQSGGWEMVYDGNGIMSCEIANGYNLPREIVPGCIDTQNSNQFITR